MLKCDVLYIHATKNPVGEDHLRYAFVPVGLVGILNHLKSKDINVLALNFAIEKELDPNFNIPDALRDIEYKVLLTDLHWYEHSFGAIYVTDSSKNIHPDRPTVIGGYTTTIYAKEILENFPSVDYAVVGDSELPTEQLVQYLLNQSNRSLSSIPNIYYRQAGTICRSDVNWVQTSLEDLDCVNTDMFLHDELFPKLGCGGAASQYRQQYICVARGCKFNCIYCCGAKKNMETLFQRCNILLRSAPKLAEDFIRVYKKGIKHVSPSHDMIMFGKAYYKELFAKIREYDIKGGLYLECFQLPTKDYIDEIASTFDVKHTTLVLSPISGNEKLRQENGKLFSNEDFYETIEYILSKGIYLQLYYTMNVYGETREEYYDTYFQIKYCHDIYGLDAKHIFYQRIVLDPLAGMRDMDGIQVELNSFLDYYRYCQVPTGNFSYAGFESNCEVSTKEKKETFYSLMGFENISTD